MPDSWWSLGEGSGYQDAALSVHRITCPFCLERGNFGAVYHAEKKKPNGSKKLNFDTLQCGNCAAYVMVLWSIGAGGLHDFRVLPWPLLIDKAPEYLPEAVGRYWLQAQRNLRDENWDAAALMARSALQLALREQGASGSTLKAEVEDLATKGILPPLMHAWSTEVRELGNESAHPGPSQNPTSPQDAQDVVHFMEFLLEYLYDLPHRIAKYRKRRSGSVGQE